MYIYVNKPCCDALSKREVYHPQQLISFGYHICLLYLVIYPYSNQSREGTTVLLTHTQIFLCVDTFSDTKLCCLMQGFTRVEQRPTSSLLYFKQMRCDIKKWQDGGGIYRLFSTSTYSLSFSFCSSSLHQYIMGKNRIQSMAVLIQNNTGEFQRQLELTILLLFSIALFVVCFFIIDD